MTNYLKVRDGIHFLFRKSREDLNFEEFIHELKSKKDLERCLSTGIELIDLVLVQFALENKIDLSDYLTRWIVMKQAAESGDWIITQSLVDYGCEKKFDLGQIQKLCEIEGLDEELLQPEQCTEDEGVLSYLCY